MFESHFSARFALLSLGLLLSCLVGCAPKVEKTPQPSAQQEEAASEVPLRIWIASPVADAAIIRRQWLADSNQPIEIVEIGIDELLQSQSLACDVVVFPARLLGELIHRQAIAKLPESVAAKHLSQELSNEEGTLSLLPAERAQVLYDGDIYAMPLGCSIPVVVASNAFAKDVSGPISWKSLEQRLDQSASPSVVEPQTVNSEALVDRFLAIAASLTDRSPSYGLLFEMQSMQPRLTQPEFVGAAKILLSLFRQPGGAVSVTGSHAEAWKWASQNEQAVVSIASATQLDREARAITSGKIITVGDRSQLAGWNTGGGMSAALSTSCRQTAQSVRFLLWLRESQNRAALSPVIRGVDSDIPPAGADQLSWIARQHIMPAMQSDSLPQEPSLPSAHQYRAELGSALLRMLAGELSASEALAEADKAWQKTTRNAESEQRREYEKSLGLTL